MVDQQLERVDDQNNEFDQKRESIKLSILTVRKFSSPKLKTLVGIRIESQKISNCQPISLSLSFSLLIQKSVVFWLINYRSISKTEIHCVGICDKRNILDLKRSQKPACFFRNQRMMKICPLLRGVENKQIARNISFIYFTNIFYYPDYSKMKNKEEEGKVPTLFFLPKHDLLNVSRGWKRKRKRR